MTDVAAKWDRIYRQRSDAAGAPAQVLTDNTHLLPARGACLDLACGLGANALTMARLGLDVTAWDISPVAIARLARAAVAESLTIAATVRDVERDPPDPDSFDVIVVSRFLERAICPRISAALRPGGLLFYQTFTRTRVTSSGPSNPRFLLDDHELLALFSPLRVLVFREEGLTGDLARGLRNEACLVAQRD